jgi:hypothetical protein
MGIYTHIGLNDQSSAIELLPAPPELRPGVRPAKEMNGKGDLDALWAELPEHVKAGLLAMAIGAGCYLGVQLGRCYQLPVLPILHSGSVPCYNRQNFGSAAERLVVKAENAQQGCFHSDQVAF